MVLWLPETSNVVDMIEECSAVWRLVFNRDGVSQMPVAASHFQRGWISGCVYESGQAKDGDAKRDKKRVWGSEWTDSQYSGTEEGRGGWCEGKWRREDSKDERW